MFDGILDDNTSVAADFHQLTGTTELTEIALRVLLSILRFVGVIVVSKVLFRVWLVCNDCRPC